MATILLSLQYSIISLSLKRNKYSIFPSKSFATAVFLFTAKSIPQ
ncbi:hypothetical protein [Acidianus manzaensis]|nr:hypothetical protein [Acidianus manzaensis]